MFFPSHVPCFHSASASSRGTPFFRFTGALSTFSCIDPHRNYQQWTCSLGIPHSQSLQDLYNLCFNYVQLRSTQIHPAVTSDFNATEQNSFGSCTNTFHKSDVESVDKVKQAPQSLDSLRPSPSILRTSLTSIRKMLRGFSVGNSWASNKSFAKMQQKSAPKPAQILYSILHTGCSQEHWMLARFNCSFFGSFKAHKSQCHRSLSGRINKICKYSKLRYQ